MAKLKSSYSSFWLDKSMFLDEDKYEVTSDVERRSNDIMKLVSYKRAVSNFVNIVTGMPIRVTFDERGTDSYTNGKEVVISSKMDDGEFDPVVGLALHEGSHIKLTDFETLHKMTREDFLPSTIDVEYLKERFGLETQGSISTTIYDKLKDLLNVVEDRRIDNYIFSTAPGYRGYYEAMYDKYFNAKIIDKGLQSAECRTEDWDSYMFRIVNITNPNRDLDALKSLREIWNVLDLRNISRLKTSWDALEVAGQIFMIVQKSVDAAKQDESDEGNEPNQEEMNGSSDMSGDMDNESPNQGMNSTTQVQGEPTDSGDDSDSQPEQLSANQVEQLRKAIEKQKKFQEGDIQKKKLNKGEKRKVDVLEKSEIDIQVTGKNLNERSVYKNGGTQTYVIRNFTKDLVDTNQFSILTNSEWRTERNVANIQKGIQMGILLGKKLKTRSEERSLITPRMKSGKLSGRMIHEIGFGNFDIFERTMVNKSKPAIIHISIDASGSMGGDKWNNTQVAAIAIAKAASMTQNLDVVITYRSTSGYGSEYLPFILVAYDSRKDKFNKIQNLFHHIEPNGTTPEGLCFEAILKDIVSYSKGADAYFVNFSDGCPTFSNQTISYEGESAFKHTADQVKKIRQSGVNVLSYFISDGYVGYDAQNFRKMYGSDAHFIDVTELTPLAKSLNSKFEANLTI